MIIQGIEYVSTSEAARRLGLERNAVAHYARQGRVLHPVTGEVVEKGEGLPWLIPVAPETGLPVIAEPKVRRRRPKWRDAADGAPEDAPEGE